MPRKKEASATASFEENLQSLEEIVAKMERGEIPLDELMQDYAAGMKLAKQCRMALADAEKAIDLTVGENSEPLPLFLEE